MISTYQLRLDTNINDSKKAYIEEQIKQLNSNLLEIEKGLEDLAYREANRKVGYVYIISNIGSFGENIYKIGMTRRLKPLDRIDELSSASVPFKYDVHAMIFSENAPLLEAYLHKRFENQRVNLMNTRKEFFNIPLENIKQAVADFGQGTNFIEIPPAQQYRESLRKKQLLQENFD